MFSCEFCEIFQNNFFTEHLRATASFFKWLHIQIIKHVHDMTQGVLQKKHYPTVSELNNSIIYKTPEIYW